jgi:putative solute:sodium symporter small subunit
MRRRAAHSFRTRMAVTAMVALLWCALALLVLPLADARPDVMLFGLPLRLALALPVAVPVLVLTMFWFAFRQNRMDERFRHDD